MRQQEAQLSRCPSIIGTMPMIVVAVGVFVIGIVFSIIWSFTSSKLFPNFNFVGLAQYERLWATDRWLVSVNNIWFFGLLSIAFNMVFGYLLAVFMDQRIRQEDLFRSIFLYPFAMSLVVTGLVWQWMLDPNLGIQAAVRNSGWASFSFAPLVDGETAIYGLVVAGIWNGVGVTMAILLAGLRGVDAEIWKAAKVDGIPTWRTYLFIVAADDARRHRHRLHPAVRRRRPRLRPRRRHDRRRPGHLDADAGHLRHPAHHRSARTSARAWPRRP